MDYGQIVLDGVRAALGPTAAVYALAAIGLNVHLGYTGLLNFGQAGFMLLGAYGVAITVAVFSGPLLVGALAGVVLAVVLAVLIGAATLRLHAAYLAVVTITAAEMLRGVVRSGLALPYTGGVFGLERFAGEFYALNPIPPGVYALGVIEFGSHRRVWLLLVGWTLVLLASLFVWALVRSPWGRLAAAVRDDEEAVRGLGKDAFALKLQSFVLGAVFGALAGVVLALDEQAVRPDVFLPAVTLLAYTSLVAGGVGRVAGPVVGAVAVWLVVAALDSFLAQLGASGALDPERVALWAVRLGVIALALLLLLVYRPQGLCGRRRDLLDGLIRFQ